jgi:hypothetical protein
MIGGPADDRDAEQDEARRVVAKVMTELDAARLAYGPVYDEVSGSGRLDEPIRESVIEVIARVATVLRHLAKSLGTTRTLPEEEQPDVALILLRLLTDSLSVALAKEPDAELMVAPEDVDALFREVWTTTHASRPNG